MAVAIPESMQCQCIICTQFRKYPPKENKPMASGEFAAEVIAEQIGDLNGDIEMIMRDITTIKRKLDVVINALYMNGLIETVYVGDAYVSEHGGNGFRAKVRDTPEVQSDPYDEMMLDNL